VTVAGIGILAVGYEISTGLATGRWNPMTFLTGCQQTQTDEDGGRGSLANHLVE
jgi:hypothetical protein